MPLKHGYVPCVIQYILVASHNSLYLLIPYHCFALPPFPLPTGSHEFVLYICESDSFMLDLLACSIFLDSM